MSYIFSLNHWKWPELFYVSILIFCQYIRMEKQAIRIKVLREKNFKKMLNNQFSKSIIILWIGLTKIEESKTN